MPAVRSTVLLGVLALVVLAGVLVTLVAQVGAAAEWTPPDRAAPAAREGRTCTNADLRLAVDDLADEPGGERRQLALVWRNASTTACRVEGFPIVDLVGPPTPRFGTSAYGSIVNVPRDEVRARPITLGSGESVRSVVRWRPPGSRTGPPGGQAWTPDRLVVATPGEARNQSVAWPAGPVLVGPVDERGVSFGPLTAS